MLSGSELSLAIKAKASELGFSLCGISPAARPDTFPALQEWIRKDHHGEMGYMERREAAYEHPQSALKSVKSLIVVGASYAPGQPTPEGRVAAYALGQQDYHDVLREKLKLLADLLYSERMGCRTRGIVDTAPVLERDFGRKAGLGWFGKNTMLINKQVGSFFFLAALLTDVEIPPDEMHESSHCGTCTRCLDVCPTDAFDGPYVLDARKCISYLTIELRDQPIPHALRDGIGEWLFGCDLCQNVCPWNRKPDPMIMEPLVAVDRVLEASRLLLMSEPTFEGEFAGTPFLRPGRVNMARNAAIVLGNSGNSQFTQTLQQGLKDDSPIVQEACAWAITKLSRVDSI